MKKYINKKKKRGSIKRAEPRTSLILICNNVKFSKYINLSIYNNDSHAGMAEWLTHVTDTDDPSGFVGSIPTPGVTLFLLNFRGRKYEK